MQLLIYEKHVNGTAFWRGLTDEEKGTILSRFSAFYPDLTIRDGKRVTYKSGHKLGDGVHVPVRIDE